MSAPTEPTPVGRWLALAEELLGRAAPRLNALNLFPVPDADTGSNMHATLAVARRAAEGSEGEQDLGALLGLAGRAALDAARGNSGTLLAVALAAMAEPLRGARDFVTPDLARAFDAADQAARSALSDPCEGTILSVLTAAATSLSAASEAAVDPATATADMVADARRAVEASEGQLAALADARVVDAGAVGMLWVLEALRAAATGTDVDAEIAGTLHGYAEGPERTGRADPGDAPAGESGVEVMCTLALAPLDAAGVRQALEAVGDAVILAPLTRTPDAAGRLPWRVHVHVPRADDALAVLTAAGEPEGVHVTDLDAHEHDERHAH